MLTALFNWTWRTEYAPTRWREGTIVSLFKKGARTDPGNYRGIMLLNTVGKVFGKVLNARLVSVLEEQGVLVESQAGFRQGRNCVDHIYTLSAPVQGRKRNSKPTYAPFLDIKKAYDTVWRNGLWYKLWKCGVRGKMWRMISNLTECTSSAVRLDGELSEFFPITEGVPQGDTLSPTLFSVFINDMPQTVRDSLPVGGGVPIPGPPAGEDQGVVPALLFADDGVDTATTGDFLQAQISTIRKYTLRWRLHVNTPKCGGVVFN